MEIEWEDPPLPDGPFFTRDAYDKYTLAPNIRELWGFLQSPAENTSMRQKRQECDFGAAKASHSRSTEDTAEFKENSCISEEASQWESFDSNANAAEGAEGCKGPKAQVKPKRAKTQADVVFPEPRLPYPCMSSLSIPQQRTYLDFLMKKLKTAPPKKLQVIVNEEVMHFTRYLQDVASRCAEDYNVISEGAMRYSEDFFKGCLDGMKSLPQRYKINEMTSLTGGTFNPRLKLAFEKQLLILGNVDITDHKITPADAQLASDYHSVSSENPPAKKAKDMYATISSDRNAEALSARYEPHVCMTRDALVKLLDNHGPNFEEQWEIPVWVKSNTGKGRRKKTVYIDSPLLKTEATIRERNRIFHEESLKLSFIKNGSINMFHVMTEVPTSEQQISSENSQRNVVSFENSALDYVMDISDLETFGETTSIKTTKAEERQNEWAVPTPAKSPKTASSSPLSKKKMSSMSVISSRRSSSSQAELNTSSHHIIKSPLAVGEAVKSVTKQRKPDSAQESDESEAFTVDSDDEKLVIDYSGSSGTTPTPTLTSPRPECQTPSDSADPTTTHVSVKSDSSSPQKASKPRRQSKGQTVKVVGDQLSEILCMQTAMFSSIKGPAKCSSVAPESSSSPQCPEPTVYSHPTSLVKPCVTSYLEREERQDRETCAALQESAPFVTTEHKKILSADLQAGTEDERDYEAPQEGNLLYKLYSLQDLLLMVRSSVQLTHTRRAADNRSKYLPVHVLPKMEYQLSYGVECLNNSEACQLWTETLLHSSTVSYIAHINAHTSKVAMLRKLHDDWEQNISSGFKPSKSLNILHHLLKKLSGLEEGRYLIVHKAGEPIVILYKEADEKGQQGKYDLQRIHSSIPQPPASGLIPWLPVDPALCLPFHISHARVPCTFPPKAVTDPSPQQGRGGPSKNNTNVGGNTKKNKKNWKKTRRTSKRENYIRDLVKKSV